MINFSVSRPGSMSKPICTRVKNSPQNKHEYPVYPHMPSKSHSQKMAPNFCWFPTACIRNPDVLAIGLKPLRDEEEERELFFFVHTLLTSGVKIEQRAGIPGSDLHGPSIGKNGRDKSFFSPGTQNQCAQRTKNREINHSAQRFMLVKRQKPVQ